jgi:hypothetical protein
VKFTEELNQAKQELLAVLPPEHIGKAEKMFKLYNQELKWRHKLISQLSVRLKRLGK